MPLTVELGTYLEFPIIHSRVSRHQYVAVSLKVRSKLAGWQMKLLSRASRAILIQTVASTIPAYCIQSSRLPRGVIKDMEKLNRGFLWAATEEKRGMHHVAWEAVCRPKDRGP